MTLTSALIAKTGDQTPVKYAEQPALPEESAFRSTARGTVVALMVRERCAAIAAILCELSEKGLILAAGVIRHPGA